MAGTWSGAVILMMNVSFFSTISSSVIINTVHTCNSFDGNSTTLASDIKSLPGVAMWKQKQLYKHWCTKILLSHLKCFLYKEARQPLFSKLNEMSYILTESFLFIEMIFAIICNLYYCAYCINFTNRFYNTLLLYTMHLPVFQYVLANDVNVKFLSQDSSVVLLIHIVTFPWLSVTKILPVVGSVLLAILTIKE